MNWLKKAWAAIDGNKTKIGAALSFVGRLVAYFGHPEIGGPLQTVGDAVAGLGLAHAAVKSLEAPVGDDAPVVAEVRQITSSNDVFKPGMVVKGADGKVLVIKRLVRGGGKDAAGSVEFVYEAEVRG